MARLPVLLRRVAAASGASLRMISASIGDAAASSSRAARVRSLYPVRACLRDGTVITLRPIGPEDELREQAFVQALSPDSRYFRFMSTLRELPPDILYRFTHPDFEREVALVALCENEREPRQIGVARCIVQGPERDAEFAVVVADDWQARGVGKRLMYELMRAARAAGITRLWGDVLASNHRMLALMHTLGFDIVRVSEDALLRRVVKNLEEEPAGHKDLVHAT
jgi:acetyltransferase